MLNENLTPEEIKRRHEFKELKNYLKLSDDSSEHVLTTTWRFIKRMQKELNLPPQTPIGELVELFNNLEEIRQFFKLQINNFTRLNELFWEITTVRDKLNLLEESSITEVLSQITPEMLYFLNLGENSLLKRLLQLYLLKETHTV